MFLDSLYWFADSEYSAAYEALRLTSDPATRAHLLLKLRDTERAMAEADLADATWHRQIAVLMSALADVELAAATGAPRTDRATPLNRWAGPVLDEMAGTADLSTRMRLLNDLIEAVDEHLDPQAIEALWHLPAPGFDGPMTTAERDGFEELNQSGNGRTATDRADWAVHYFPLLCLWAVALTTFAGGVSGLVLMGTGRWLEAGFVGLFAGAVGFIYLRRRVLRRRFLDAPAAD